MRRNYTVWLAILLFIVAFAVRLIPLQFSQLPYNIDGFPLARISEIMIDTGHVPYASGYEGLLAYNMKMPVFSLVLSAFSLVLGMEPLTLLPYFCAFIGSFAVLFIYALTLRLTKSGIAGFAAGLFAALCGLFMYVTTAAMKQLLAIVLLTFILYLYTRRKDWRARLVMIACLVILPFTHHLTTLICLLVLSFALVGRMFKSDFLKKRVFADLMLDFLTGPAILIGSLAYYHYVNLEIVSVVVNLNDITLLCSVFILLAFATKLLSDTVQTKPWFIFGKGEDKTIGLMNIFDEKVLVLIVGIATLYLNSRINVFAGGVMTSDLLLKLMFPYLVLTVVALMGFNVIRYSRFEQRYLVVGAFMAPFCIMIFGCLRGLDAFNFTLVYRGYNFLDIPLAIAAGVGIAFVYARVKELALKQREFRALPVVILAVFVILTAATVPLAYNNEETFGIQEVTHEYEFETMDWVSGAGIHAIVTDQRYADIISPYYGVRADQTGPWKMKRGGIESGDVIFISNYWTEGGAQMSILGRVTFEQSALENYLDDFNIIYMGGPEGREVVVAIAG